MFSVKCLRPPGDAGKAPAKIIRHAFDEQLGFSASQLGEDVLDDLFVGGGAHDHLIVDVMRLREEAGKVCRRRLARRENRVHPQ